jgi:hypothetical protein
MGEIKREAREVGIIAVLACGEGGYGRICQFQLCLFLISCKCRNMITKKITRKTYNRVYFNSTLLRTQQWKRMNIFTSGNCSKCLCFYNILGGMLLPHNWRHAFATQLAHFNPPPRVKMIWLYEHKKGWNNLEPLRKTMRFPVTSTPPPILALTSFKKGLCPKIDGAKMGSCSVQWLFLKYFLGTALWSLYY